MYVLIVIQILEQSTQIEARNCNFPPLKEIRQIGLPTTRPTDRPGHMEVTLPPATFGYLSQMVGRAVEQTASTHSPLVAKLCTHTNINN